MQFVLLGFKQSNSVRQFRFEAIGDDRSRRSVLVSADLVLARGYAIQIQNLPLLCRQLLQRCDEHAIDSGEINLSEVDMASISRQERESAERALLTRRIHTPPRPQTRRPHSPVHAPFQKVPR